MAKVLYWWWMYRPGGLNHLVRDSHADGDSFVSACGLHGGDWMSASRATGDRCKRCEAADKRLNGASPHKNLEDKG